jgi:hypothetical protein
MIGNARSRCVLLNRGMALDTTNVISYKVPSHGAQVTAMV